jgi:predicted N-acetyltransferase YhbS
MTDEAESTLSTARERPRIRHAMEGDGPDMARLLTALGHPTTSDDVAAEWAEWSAAGNAALVAIDTDGVVIGVITLHRMRVLHRRQPVGRITSLIVNATARGRGVGRALVLAAEDVLVGAGCGIVEVTSHMRLDEAHTFYEHVGYERTSHRFAKTLPPSC